jgi:CheY-like chemotaxis protein/two-component sensor histidine kinase
VQLTILSDSEEDRGWSRRVIAAQVENLSRMIDDLLDVSRITRGKIELRKQDLDLRHVVNSAVEAARPLIEERKHRLLLDLVPEPLRVEGDPTRVEQILVNLLNNAAKYTESGGRITLSTRRDGRDVVIVVEDTGIGMPAELLDRAFDLFAQGDRTIARSEGGLGIGLTVVKSLVELHGGSVRGESRGIGKGSRFTVRLPLAAEQAAETGRGGRPVASSPAASSVLVVDDSVDMARSMARLLKLLGHDVGVAHDGPSAIEEAKAHRPDIILLDIGLPGMDGYQVARRLRDEGFDRTLIIAVSGYGEGTARTRSLESGFDHHLVKPVDLHSLLALIARSR